MGGHLRGESPKLEAKVRGRGRLCESKVGGRGRLRWEAVRGQSGRPCKAKVGV